MAMVDASVTLELSETLLHCQICMERLDSPRILPCQHNMCRRCLQTLALRHCVGGKYPADGDVIKAASFPCPECRKECRVGKVGSAFSNNNLLARYPENRLLKHLGDEADKYSDKNSKKVSVQAHHPEHLNSDFHEREPTKSTATPNEIAVQFAAERPPFPEPIMEDTSFFDHVYNSIDNPGLPTYENFQQTVYQFGTLLLNNSFPELKRTVSTQTDSWSIPLSRLWGNVLTGVLIVCLSVVLMHGFAFNAVQK